MNNRPHRIHLLPIKHPLFLIIALLLTGGAVGQDLRFYAGHPADSVNHSSVFEPFKALWISDYEAEEKRGVWGWMGDRLWRDNFFKVSHDHYVFTLDPLFDNYLGREMYSNKDLMGNTRGFRVQGIVWLGKDKHQPKLEFSSSYYEAQSRFAPYLDSIIRKYGAIPGQISWRGGEQYREHSYPEAWIRYTPNRIFSFEGGQGKNFFGSGYRSLFLSDANTPYPYFRIDTRIWRIHYVNLWAEFQDRNGWQGDWYPFPKKYGAFHHLSLAVTDRLELNAFEVINWQGRDSTRTRNFELTYLNPVIFLRPVEWTIGSPDNAMIGLGFSYRWMPKGYVYGQWIIDEMHVSKFLDFSKIYAVNKFGGQVGVKVTIPLGKSQTSVQMGNPLFGTEQKKQPASSLAESSFLSLQSEFNFVKPWTFSHISSRSNYGHLNFSLAHPLGANFMEWVNFVRLSVGRLTLEGRYSRAVFGADEAGRKYGHDIYQPFDYENLELSGYYIGYGNTTHLTYAGITAAYRFNPWSHFNVFVSVLNRHLQSETHTADDLLVQFGVRSSVRNIYYDF